MKTIKLTMTVSQAYQRKQRLWKAYCDYSEKVRRAFFPDTGGVSLFMHNWYICAEKTKPEESKLAQWIEDSTYARYKRLETKLEARSEAREHLNHTPGDESGFWPYWCKLCNRSH